MAEQIDACNRMNPRRNSLEVQVFDGHRPDAWSRRSRKRKDMEKEFRFTLTQEILKSTARDYFWNVRFRTIRAPFIIIASIALFFVLTSPFFGWEAALIFVVIFTVFAAPWASEYISSLKQAGVNFRTMGSPEVVLSVNQEEIAVRSEKITARFPWDDLTHFVETDCCFHLFSSTVPKMALRKDVIDNETESIVRERLPRKPR